MDLSSIDPKSLDTLLTSGGITGTVVASTIIIRRLWRMLGSEALQSVRNTAEKDLIISMSTELKRLSDEVVTLKEQYRSEIEELRKNHREERRQISKKLQEVGDLLEKVKRKNDELKQEALAAYTYMVKNVSECNNNDCMEEVKERLLKIATDDEDESNAV